MNINKFLPFLCLLVFIACANRTFGQTTDDYQLKADSLINSKDFNGALENCKLAIKKYDKKDNLELAYLHYMCGLCYEGLNQYGEALKSYTTAIKLNPHFRNAYWNKGVLNERNGKYKLAIDDYNAAIANMQQDEGGGEVLYTNIAYNELKLGEYDKALAADSVALTINPRYSRAYMSRGDVYGYEKNYKLADESYSMAIFNEESDTNKTRLSYLYRARGDTKLYRHMNKEAINDYSYAILLNPGSKIAYWNRAAAYHQNGDYLLAANDYTKAIGYYDGDTKSLSRLYDDRAVNEIGLNQFDKGIRDDSTAIAFDDKNENAYFNTAIAYTQSGNYNQGIVYYKKLFAFAKGDKKREAVFYYEIANNEYFLNEFDQVIEDCTKAIASNPDFSESYYYRAKVYFKKMNNKELAMADFNKVLALDTTKKSVSYVFSLLYTGRADEAIAILQNDLLTAKTNINIIGDYYNLACLYALINNADEANIYLKKAIDGGYAKKYAIADEDLDNIRNTDDYKDMIAGAAN